MRHIEKNSRLKTHTKSTAEALRTRSSPAPPCCCCGCAPPRPAPVDSSWSNLEKLVSYSLCARGKPPPRWRVSHSFIHSSFDAVSRSPAPPPSWTAMGKARFVILRARWRWRWRTELKIPPPVSTTSTRASTRRRRDKTRRIDDENYFQRIRVFPPLDRSPDDAFRPRRSSAKRDRKEEERKPRARCRERMDEWMRANRTRSASSSSSFPMDKKTYLQLGDVPSSTSPPCSPCADVDLNIASGSALLVETEINQPRLVCRSAESFPRRRYRRRRRREHGFNTNDPN